jgi:hypothetical protein
MEVRRGVVGRLRDANRGVVADELRRCCLYPIPGKDIQIRKGEGGRHATGLAHCGRHLCPICHPYHQSVRRKKLELRAGRVLEEHPDAQHWLLTFTARHHLGVRWIELRKAIHAVARSLQQTRRWRITIGHVRADETTWTSNGHHYHQHWLVSLPRGVDAEEWLAWLQDYFETRLRQHGRTAEWTQGWARPVTDLESVLRYQTGGGIGRELTGSATKAAPWDLPAKAFAEIWEASKGCRWWSTAGCWRLSGDTDEEIEADRERQPGEVVAYVPGVVWTYLSRETREDLHALIYDRAIDDAGFLELWARANVALGGVLGVGPPPGSV